MLRAAATALETSYDACLEKHCPSCGLALPEDPRFPREACPACGSFLEEPPLVRGALATPKTLDDFLALCGPHRELDEVTAIVKVTPKSKRFENPDITESVAVPQKKKPVDPDVTAEIDDRTVITPRRS